MRKSHFRALAENLAIALTVSTVAFGAVPSQITVQGKLTNPSGADSDGFT